jgi:putative copper export protein
VALTILTGVTRSAGELSAPAQLWDTAYGRSILYKLLLLCPIGFLALRNRRVVTSLKAVAVPSGATLRMVRRSVGIELGIAIVVVVVASVLAAQVPGRV